MYLFFAHSSAASNIETKEKMEELFKSLIDGEIEFKFGLRKKL